MRDCAVLHVSWLLLAAELHAIEVGLRPIGAATVVPAGRLLTSTFSPSAYRT